MGHPLSLSIFLSLSPFSLSLSGSFFSFLFFFSFSSFFLSLGAQNLIFFLPQLLYVFTICFFHKNQFFERSREGTTSGPLFLSFCGTSSSREDCWVVGCRVLVVCGHTAASRRYQKASFYVRGHTWRCRARGRVRCRWFCGEVLSGCHTPRTMSLALFFDLGQPRDSTSSIRSASSSTFSLCETLGRIDDSSIVLVLSLVSHVSENR